MWKPQVGSGVSRCGHMFLDLDTGCLHLETAGRLSTRLSVSLKIVGVD